jgi:hypothetical protein
MVSDGRWRSVGAGERPRKSVQTKGSLENVACLHTAEVTGSSPVSPTLRFPLVSQQPSWRHVDAYARSSVS